MTAIPAADLPSVSPGTTDSLVGVDESSGGARRFPLSALAAGISVQLSGTGTYARSLSGKASESLNLLDYIPPNMHAAVLDGSNTASLSPYVQAAFDDAILTNRELELPAAPILLESFGFGPIYLNFTAAGQSLRVRGKGRGISSFKEMDGETAAGGRFTKMFYLYVDSNIDVDSIEFTDLTFDKNGASNGTPSTLYDLEQAHIFSIAGDWDLATDAYIDALSFIRTNIRDKVGAGFHVAAQMHIGRVLVEDFYESDFADGVYGERGDIEITCWCTDITLNNVNARFVQTEPVTNYEASEGNEKLFRYNNCIIDTLQISEPDSAADFAEAIISNSKINTEFSTRGVSVKMANTTWRHSIEHWAKNAEFVNCTILLPYDSGTNAATPFYAKAIAGYPQRWYFGAGCKFVLDTTDSVSATGAAIGNSTNAKQTTAGEHVIICDGVKFDPRLQRVQGADSGNGDFHFRNCGLACWGTPAMYVGGSSTFIGRLYLSGNDYSGCAGAKVVQIVRGNALWELRWDESLPIAEYKLSYSSATAIGTCYPVRPRITTASIPTTAAASQPFFAGDRARNTLPSATSPVTEWVCITDGTPGTWRAASWLTIKGATASRPTLTSSDIGVTYLDTTLDADGKPITWTGTAWVDATGATV